MGLFDGLIRSIRTFSACKKIVGVGRKESAQFIALFLSNALLSVAFPLLIAKLFDIIANSVSIEAFLKIIILYFTASIFGSLLSSFISIIYDISEFKYGQKMRHQLMEILFCQEGQFYSQKKSGDLFATVEQDIDMIASYLFRYYKALIQLGIAVSLSVALCIMRFELLLIMIILLPIAIYINERCNKKLAVLAEKNRSDYGDQGTLTEAFISHPVEMILSGMKNDFLKRYSVAQKKYSKSYVTLSILNELSSQATELAMTVASLLSSTYGGYLAYRGDISIGVVIAYMNYSGSIISPILSIGAVNTMAAHLQPSLRRIQQLWPDRKELTQSKKTTIFENYDIVFDKVCFSYNGTCEILRNASFNFSNGEKYAIIGPSGAGKSTIINLLMKLWKPQEGNIYIGGKSIAEIDRDTLSDYISVVSQDMFFYHSSILDNLSIDCNCSEQTAIEALNCVDLWEYINALPEGLHTIIGDNGITLSGGQRQRLAIARVLIKNSPICIFDEPTSALDYETEKIIYQTIEKMQDKTIIIISHRSSALDIVDNIYEFKDKSLLQLDVPKPLKK